MEMQNTSDMDRERCSFQKEVVGGRLGMRRDETSIPFKRNFRIRP